MYHGGGTAEASGSNRAEVPGADPARIDVENGGTYEKEEKAGAYQGAIIRISQR